MKNKNLREAIKAENLVNDFLSSLMPRLYNIMQSNFQIKKQEDALYKKSKENVDKVIESTKNIEDEFDKISCYLTIEKNINSVFLNVEHTITLPEYTNYGNIYKAERHIKIYSLKTDEPVNYQQNFERFDFEEEKDKREKYFMLKQRAEHLERKAKDLKKELATPPEIE